MSIRVMGNVPITDKERELSEKLNKLLDAEAHQFLLIDRESTGADGPAIYRAHSNMTEVPELMVMLLNFVDGFLENNEDFAKFAGIASRRALERILETGVAERPEGKYRGN